MPPTPSKIGLRQCAIYLQNKYRLIRVSVFVLLV